MIIVSWCTRFASIILQFRPRVTAASGDEVDRTSDSQAMKSYIEIDEMTKADAMKLFEQEMEK